MKKYMLLLILSVISIQSHGQKEDKNSKIGYKSMYNGTESNKSKSYFQQASKYSSTGDYKKAIKYYQMAIDEDPNFVEAYDNIGVCYRQLNDINKAIKYYKKSIALYPEGKTAHQNLAVAYEKNGDFKEALKEYKKLKNLDPDDPEAYFGLAKIYLNTNKNTDGLENAKQAVALYKAEESPYLGDGYILLVAAYLINENIDSAKFYYRMAEKEGVELPANLSKALKSAKTNGEDNQIMSPTSTKNKIESTSKNELSEADYRAMEPKIREDYQWLINTPLGTDTNMRKQKYKEVLLWATGSPYFEMEIDSESLPYPDCGDCLMMWIAGGVNYAIVNKDYKNVEKISEAGNRTLEVFLQKNPEVLKELNEKKNTDEDDIDDE